VYAITPQIVNDTKIEIDKWFENQVNNTSSNIKPQQLSFFNS